MSLEPKRLPLGPVGRAPRNSSYGYVVGNFCGYLVFALGIWIIFDGLALAVSLSVIRTLYPIEVALGLLLAIEGVGLAKRYMFALWILAAWVAFLFSVTLYVLSLKVRGVAGTTAFEWPWGYIILPMSVLLLAYFFSQRTHFRHIRFSASNRRQSRTDLG